MTSTRFASAAHTGTAAPSSSAARVYSSASSDHEWPYPKATRPPSHRTSLVWSQSLRQRVFIFNEIFCSSAHSIIPRRTVLYSARKPPKLFIASDNRKTGAPPARRGSVLTADRLWPLYQPEWLRFKQDEYPAGTCHYKQPDLPDGVHSLRCEIDAQELFRRQPSPHPNLPLYLGCAVDNGYVAEVVFKSYTCTLAEMVDRGAASDELWRATVLSQLKDAVEYVHSLGLAHNDISPNNIMFDNDLSSRPILVDFDSAQPPGITLGMDDKYGTPGFCVEDMTISAFENDSYSLCALEDFMQGDGAAY